MATPVIQPSFAAGELSPGLYARTDLAKFHTGAAFLRNFFVDVRGGVSNRPGTSYVGTSKQSTPSYMSGCVGVPPRIIPFTFSTTQTYILEFGNVYMRVVMNGGYVLEPAKVITAITQANPAVVTSAAHGFVNGDWVFISGVVGMTQVNNRTFVVAGAAANTFQLNDYFGATVDSTAYTAYISGGTVARVFTLTTPYSAVDLPLIKFAQSADVLTITHPLYPPADITRTGNAAWTYTPITFQPDINPPAALSIGGSSTGGVFTYRYVVTAVSLSSGEESRPSVIKFLTNMVQMSVTPGAIIQVTWAPVAGAAYYNVYRQPEIDPVPDIGLLFGFVGTTTGISFTDQNISPDFSRTPPQPRNPFANSPILYWTVTSPGTGYLVTDTITIIDGTGSGWAGFLDTDPVTGAVQAIITVNAGHDFTNPSVTGGSGVGLTATATLGKPSGNYPGCVTYFQQRKVFAGSLNNPETFWMTQTGNYRNMDVSVPARDSDAITATIASTQVNAIKFLIPMASGLIIGSSSGAWQVSGGASFQPVTPSNIIAAPQAFNGASDVQPIPVNYDILYVQSKQNVVRDLTYNFYVNNYTGADMTVLSNHLFNGFQIIEWAYQDEPSKIVWAIRNDGTLLSFSFLKEQEVYAWAHHDTLGTFRSVASISEGDENIVYFIVERKIPGVNGGNFVFYLERMHSRQLVKPWTDFKPDPTAAWFVDCGLQYSLVTPQACITPSSTIGVVNIVSDVPIFHVEDVGGIMRFSLGKMLITTYSTSTFVQVLTIVPLADAFQVPNDNWTMTQPVTVIHGLDHLNGADVIVLSNGSVEGPYTVVDGSITLQVASDIVTVGLPYTAQGTTLYIDTGVPTIQGKRKTITGVTAFVENSRGLAFSGSGFDSLVEMKERTNEQMGEPTRLQTGQERVNVHSDWQVFGQVYWQESYPLPCTVLGLVNDLTVGDTAGRD